VNKALGQDTANGMLESLMQHERVLSKTLDAIDAELESFANSAPAVANPTGGLVSPRTLMKLPAVKLAPSARIDVVSRLMAARLEVNLFQSNHGFVRTQFPAIRPSPLSDAVLNK